MQVINPKRVVEETKTEEVVPVVEEPKKEETAVAVVYPNPFEKQGEVAPAVQEGKNDEATTVVELPEQEAEAVVESVSIDDVMANTVATVEEPVQIQTEQVATQAMDAEEQAKLAENVQAILNEEQPEEKTDLDILKKTKELGDSIAQLQQDVAVSLASKQRELNEVKEENNRLTNEVTKAREGIEENEKVYQLYKEHKSYRKVAKMTGISDKTIKKWIDEYEEYYTKQKAINEQANGSNEIESAEMRNAE